MQLDYVLLALIRMRPGISGYQLKSIINDSTSFFFTVRNSQIYPALRRMVADGTATFETVIQDGKPNLKLYTITDEGTQELEAWLLERFDFQWNRASYDLYFLKLILMGHLDPARIVAYLDWGIEMISQHRQQMLDEHLAIEQNYLQTDDAAVQDRFFTIWGEEYAYIVKDMADRIEELTVLKKKLTASASA